MSQEQPQKPQPDRDPIRYGDVFNVHGTLATTVIAPEDAKTMQSAEDSVLGETRKGGPASAMQSAASINLREGFVDADQATQVSVHPGTGVTEKTIGGDRIITERIAGQMVAQYVEPKTETTTPGGVLDPFSVTIGEALEATALSTGKKPVDQSDAAAIQAAEVRATGINEVLPGGVGAEAQSAADRNLKAPRVQDKTKISDVVADATLKLPADKPVTREDARGVIEAEVRNKPDMHATPGGVAASMAAAARANRE
ncbi:late embryogenesis abundant protein D-34-like [Mercurialis annua]|uniref:late embryogenesis abundant protein D-34-like n=1 Tax=Mercurialis annua TaxID=3986 RepID=UPI00215E8BA2|nr:late embryogenesis abundant protein D-34-like [Mercurialis annua]